MFLNAGLNSFIHGPQDTVADLCIKKKISFDGLLKRTKIKFDADGKVNAIKLVRAETAASLVEAKKFVDLIAEQ